MSSVLPITTEITSCGLPGLLLTLDNADRTEPLTMIGPRGLERVVNALREIVRNFRLKYVLLRLRNRKCGWELNGYCIHAFRVNHNVTCYRLFGRNKTCREV